MKNLHILHRLITAVLLCFSVPSFAAVQTLVVENGLSLPVFVGNAGDGTNRLFIEEQIGVIRVLQSGAPVSSVFRTSCHGICESASCEGAWLALAGEWHSMQCEM
jgi:hypothetical protein